jgi:hypothetical protein
MRGGLVMLVLVLSAGLASSQGAHASSARAAVEHRRRGRRAARLHGFHPVRRLRIRAHPHSHAFHRRGTIPNRGRNRVLPRRIAAIQALQVASRYDLHTVGVSYIGRFGALYPIYVRGQAYLAARQPAAAAGEFHRILDHRSIVLVDPMDAMARLQLARALALSGDTVKAKSAYRDLFTLWKNADSDIPVLKAARAEYGRLP